MKYNLKKIQGHRSVISPRGEEKRTYEGSLQERPSLTFAVLIARPTKATRAADDKLRIEYDALLGALGILARDLAVLLGLGTRLLQAQAGTDRLALLGDARAEPIGARKPVGAARLSVGLRPVRGARRRRPGARLGDIALVVLGRAAHLRRGRKLACVGAAGTREGVAQCARTQLARRRVTTRRVDPCARIAIFAVFDDAVAAHLQRERLRGWIRRRDACHIELVVLHDRANVPYCAGGEDLFAARRDGRHEEAGGRVASLRVERAAVVGEGAAVCAVVLEDGSIRTDSGGYAVRKGLTIAPKLCPISCATTCHSVRPPVLTAVPLTTLGALPVDFWLQRVPNHATPTSVPDGQPDMRCQRPLGSVLPFKLLNFCPRQAEKSERRSLSDTDPQALFHGLAVSLAGQLQGPIVSRQ